MTTETTTKPGVLAVMDRVEAGIGRVGHMVTRRELTEARAAVAELFEAADWLMATGMNAHSKNPKCVRLRAALAAFRGES